VLSSVCFDLCFDIFVVVAVAVRTMCSIPISDALAYSTVSIQSV
jgi:hypothetical protein